jgi:hypothetical protein
MHCKIKCINDKEYQRYAGIIVEDKLFLRASSAPVIRCVSFGFFQGLGGNQGPEVDDYLLLC